MKKTVMFVSFLCLSFLSIMARAEFAVANVQTSEGNHYFWKINASSVSAAEKVAMDNCKKTKKKQGYKNNCVISDSGKGPAYLAFFDASNGGFGWAADSDKQSAINTAYLKCNEYGECPRMPSNVVLDEGPNIAPVVNNQPGKQCSPPAGRVVHSQTYCTNGNCTRTFDNGCTIHFQAVYCHDPFKGNWEWKPDGCWCLMF